MLWNTHFYRQSTFYSLEYIFNLYIYFFFYLATILIQTVELSKICIRINNKKYSIQIYLQIKQHRIRLTTLNTMYLVPYCSYVKGYRLKVSIRLSQLCFDNCLAFLESLSLYPAMADDSDRKSGDIRGNAYVISYSPTSNLSIASDKASRDKMRGATCTGNGRVPVISAGSGKLFLNVSVTVIICMTTLTVLSLVSSQQFKVVLY